MLKNHALAALQSLVIGCRLGAAPSAARGVPLLLAALIGSACSTSPAASGATAGLAQGSVARLPPGAQLAYSAFRHGAMDLFLMVAGPAGPRLLVGDSADESHAAWSPDGKRLAFVSIGDGRAILRVLNVSTGKTADLVLHPPASDSPIPEAMGPLSWSPDDKVVAFASPLAFDADVWLATTDGTGYAGLLIQGSGTQAAPAWSPDGKRLAYACQGFAGPTDLDLCLANATGGDVTRVTSGPAQDSDPSWSPDGRRLAYASRPACVDAVGCLVSEILIVGFDTGQPTSLTRAVQDDYGPAWSPDGSFIAFTRNDEIWLMNADGSGQAPLVAGQWPAWRPAEGRTP